MGTVDFLEARYDISPGMQQSHTNSHGERDLMQPSATVCFLEAVSIVNKSIASDATIVQAPCIFLSLDQLSPR